MFMNSNMLFYCSAALPFGKSFVRHDHQPIVSLLFYRQSSFHSQLVESQLNHVSAYRFWLYLPHFFVSFKHVKTTEIQAFIHSNIKTNPSSLPWSPIKCQTPKKSWSNARSYHPWTALAVWLSPSCHCCRALQTFIAVQVLIILKFITLDFHASHTVQLQTLNNWKIFYHNIPISSLSSSFFKVHSALLLPSSISVEQLHSPTTSPSQQIWILYPCQTNSVSRGACFLTLHKSESACLNYVQRPQFQQNFQTTVSFLSSGGTISFNVPFSACLPHCYFQHSV